MKLHSLDLNFQNVPHVIAAYLVIGPEGPVLIETGPGSTVTTLQTRLSEHGYSPGDIKHVLVTHIHLDHAGAAGWWAQQGAQIYVHHVGAPHLIDPSRLLASASRIYGDQMDTLWGKTVPAPAEKVTTVRDGDTIEVAGLTFTVLDTPGHASHHHVYRLGDIAFMGDAIGITVPESAFIDLPAPPPEFDLKTWQQTVERLKGEAFSVAYPTHYGRVEDVSAHLSSFKSLLTQAANFVRDQMAAGVERDELVERYQKWNRDRAAALNAPQEVLHQYETANPTYMTVDGIMRYWRKQER